MKRDDRRYVCIVSRTTHSLVHSYYVTQAMGEEMIASAKCTNN
jgi:hypothetical protein